MQDNIIELKKLPDPPGGLTPEQADIWRTVITSRAGELIEPGSFPILVEYCRAITLANAVAAQIDSFDPVRATSAEGLRRWDKLLAMQDRVAGKVASLAVKLRLTPSTQIRPETAGRIAARGAKTRPWER